MRVIVVGGGFAGIAAAMTARAQGAEVTLLRGRSGASVLGCGAYDLEGWDVHGGDRAELSSAVGELLSRIEAPIVVEGARVVTMFGSLRPCRARDTQVLSIDPSAPIVVPRMPVAGFDADAIAAALDPTVRAAGGSARAFDATLAHSLSESRMPLADLAALHDDPERAEWLIARLRDLLRLVAMEGATCRAILLPPILGISPLTVARVRKALGVRIGEVLGEPGGPAAMRHARWAEQALRHAGVELVDGEAKSVSSKRVRLAPGGSVREIVSDRVILAVGGVLGGGLVFGTREHELGGELPAAPEASLRLSLAVDRGTSEPVVTWHDGSPLPAAASLFGADADLMIVGSHPTLVRAGLAVDRDGRVLDRAGKAVTWLFAAGDVVADRPRTALLALQSGIDVGRAAAV